MSAGNSGGVEVLVAGAGPVGLTAAYELVRRGITVRIVDRAAGPAVTSRATATHARTLEVYHQMGILPDLLARGQKCDHFTMHRRGRRLTSLGTDYSELPTRFPFTLQVDQVITEEVLRTRLGELGVEVEWGVELESLVDDRNGVTARLRRVDDGTTEEFTTGWLVGADGAHSRVRKQLGIDLLGESSEKWMVADAYVDVDLPRDSLHWMHLSHGTILMVPFPEEGKWRLLDTDDVTDGDRPEVVRARFEAKMSEGLGRTVTVKELTWVSVFTIRQRMVETMHSGHCFLAGDAAHVHSPASGQGLNTGIQDGYNLAWKLASVIKGQADGGLLESYSAERVPIGEILLGSTKTATRLIALRNAAAPVLLPVGLGLLNVLKPLKHKVERKILRGMSGLALHYRASPLTAGAPGSGDDAPALAIRPGDRVSCSAEELADSPGWQEVCDELTDLRWTLLVFAGSGDVPAAVGRVHEEYGDALSVRIVRETQPTDSGGAEAGPRVLCDPGRRVRRAFAGEPGYALVRPDGYLAALGPLGDGECLDALLRRVHLLPARRFTVAPAGSAE
ncbi:FAD-dependent oxidoreductase [Streptomyces sp. TRM68416]|uniref:FAD-dependent oxidoreductase n=1 Tax=Streptomyces sp. TRM68416 TaxID=2758412 RepID=UPI001661997E|nr:FAD-dependent oxidoreductase [Streptomyces sp. TRM68416]MBD0842310.1 FAD-dependent monooxygenase [Streptomyces sp. TRM68416]